jgi:hypothetical protein
MEGTSMAEWRAMVLVRRAKAGEPGRRWKGISATASADEQRMLVFSHGLDLVGVFPADAWQRMLAGAVVGWMGYSWEMTGEG